MTQPFRYLSATDGYNPIATQYVVNFVRRPEEFCLNRYTQYVEAPAPSFVYYELDRDQPIRIRNPALHVWNDGAKRPRRDDNQFGFRERQAFCIRYDHNSKVGDVALKMARKTWEAKTYYLAGLASQAMTNKTLIVWRGIDGTGTLAASDTVWTGLDNVNTWPSTNAADVNTLNNAAGTWDRASANEADSGYMAIRKSLLAAANAIFLQTNGRVKWRDLRLVISPNLAKAMSNTGEIREYYKYGPFAQKAIEGPENYNEEYGLPPKLYGIEVCVEDAQILTDLPTAGQTAASVNRGFIKSDHNAVILSKQGKIDALVGPSFSTFQVYWFEEQMRTEEFHDAEDRLTHFHITDYQTPVATATAAGYMIQNVLS